MVTPSDLERQIIEMADRDDDFRAALLKDANRAIEKKLGITAPEKLNIVVLEDTADTIHLVLPPKLIEGEAVAWY